MDSAAEKISITSFKGIAVLVLIGGVVLGLRSQHPVNVNFPELLKENVIGLLTGLIVIALFIERAVEVIVSPWRGPRSQMMTKKIKYEKDKLEKGSVPELSEMESELLRHKAVTKRIASVIALALGMTISASGVRGMKSLMGLEMEACTPFFSALDVLLTGALLGGGADGLHRIVVVFTSIMDKSAEKTKSA